MTRDEAIQQLRKLNEGRVDPESAHSYADDVLLDLIGDDEIRRLWEAVPKWYA